MSYSSVEQNGRSHGVLPKSQILTPHIVVLFVCLIILLGSVLLTPAGSAEEPLYLGPLPIPHTCVFKNLTGRPCPGCGLTRSIVAAAHGDVTQSFHFHRLGLLTLVYILLQFIYRFAAIVAPSLTVRLLGLEKYLNRGFVVLAALFVLNWVYLFLS
jgi:hypothetical protein